MKHKIFIPLIALMIGVICVLPYILGYIEYGRDYEPFTSLFTSPVVFDEVAVYAPPVSYLKETGSLPFETEIKEFGAVLNIKYHLPIVIEGFMARMLNSTRAAWISIEFLFPALSFLLAFWIAKKLSDNMFIALLSAVAFSTVGFGMRTLLDLGYNDAQPILFSRMQSPVATLPFLLLFIIGLIKAIEGGKIRWVITSGIIGGLLFYTYYYYQVAGAIAILILLIWYSFRKEWLRARSFLFIGIIMNIVAIPWHIVYIKTITASTEFTSKWQPIPFAPPREHWLFIIAVMGLIGISWYARKKSRGDANYIPLPPAYTPILALITSSALLEFVVAPITPFILEPAHFTQQIIIGFGILTGLSFIGKRYFLLLKPAIALIGIMLLGAASIKQVSVWENSKSYFKASTEERSAENLIKTRTSVNDVIAFNNIYHNSAMPARVWRYRFYAFSGSSSISRDENIKRYVFTRKMFGASWSEVKMDLRGSGATTESPLKTSTIPFLLTFNTMTLSLNEIEEAKKFYETVTADFLTQREMDYIVTMPREIKNLERGITLLKIDIRKEAEKEGVTLYKLN